MAALRCICGHDESMHFGPSGQCKKVIARGAWPEGRQRCTCREFRPEAAAPGKEGA